MAESWARKLYLSKAWVDLRIRLIQERGPVCQQCGRIMANTSSLIGHHKKELTPENVTNPMIALNPDNIELICSDCHNQEHQRFGKNSRNIFLVFGSPCSGKTTLVNQLKKRGDLIVEMNQLYMAVSGCCIYDKPNNLRKNIFQMRDLLLDNIRTRYGGWNDAYIIGGYPRQQEREELASRLGAEVIYCRSTEAECMAKAELLGPFAQEWQGYVHKWWEDCEGIPPVA